MKTENENKTMIRVSEGAVTDQSKSMLDKERNKAEKFKTSDFPINGHSFWLYVSNF